MLKKLRLADSGDTIVEVLIALAILTLVLGGAYYTASQSYRNDLSAQEHTEALTVAQTQIENLRTYGDTFNNSTSCLKVAGGSLSAVGSPSTTNCWMSGGSTNVYYGNSGQSNCLAGDNTSYCYNVQISNLGPVSISTTIVYTYRVSVNWHALGGGKDYVTLFYRVDNS